MSDPVGEARERLVALRDAHAAGTLDAAAHERERSRVERRLGDRLLADDALDAVRAAFAGAVAPGGAAEAAIAAPDPGGHPRAARPSAATSLGVVAFVVVLAVAGYARTGSPTLAFGVPPLAGAAPATTAAAEGVEPGASGIGLPQIAAMVESLSSRLADRPDDVEGWTMLARSYSVLGRFADAVPAYRRASELKPGDATLLADWADAAAATRGKVDHAEPAELIARALAIDPKQPKALALAGTAAYERGDYAGAIGRWRAIVAQLPPGSPVAAEIESSIAEAAARRDATARAAGSAAAPAAAIAATPPATSGVAAPSPTTANGTAPPAATIAITGTVTLSPSLAATAAPGDTVFVFARDADGGRMPLAVQRATVADLPLAFRLDDAMAMAPSARLSQAKRLVVGARVSKGGGAMPRAGDLAGEAALPVAPGTTGVTIAIDRALR